MAQIFKRRPNGPRGAQKSGTGGGPVPRLRETCSKGRVIPRAERGGREKPAKTRRERGEVRRERVKRLQFSLDRFVELPRVWTVTAKKHDAAFSWLPGRDCCRNRQQNRRLGFGRLVCCFPATDTSDAHTATGSWSHRNEERLR